MDVKNMHSYHTCLLLDHPVSSSRVNIVLLKSVIPNGVWQSTSSNDESTNFHRIFEGVAIINEFL